MKIEVVKGVDLCCRNCQKNFWICRPCYRNNKYCSTVCSKEGRKKSQKVSKLKYENSIEGRKDHRDRQQSYRDRLKEFLGTLQGNVTEHSITTCDLPIEADPELAGSSDFCRLCQVSRYEFIGEDL